MLKVNRGRSFLSCGASCAGRVVNNQGSALTRESSGEGGLSPVMNHTFGWAGGKGGVGTPKADAMLRSSGRAVGTPIETIRAKMRACGHDKCEVWRSEWVSPFPNGRGSEPSPRGSCGYRRTTVAGHKRFRGRPSFWRQTLVPQRDDVLVSCTI